MRDVVAGVDVGVATSRSSAAVPQRGREAARFASVRCESLAIPRGVSSRDERERDTHRERERVRDTRIPRVCTHVNDSGGVFESASDDEQERGRGIKERERETKRTRERKEETERVRGYTGRRRVAAAR